MEFSPRACCTLTFCPEDAGLKRLKTADILSSGNIHFEADRFVKVLAGQDFPACIDFTCLNAGAILYTAGKCEDLKKGACLSREIIESGLATKKLQEWASVQGYS